MNPPSKPGSRLASIDALRGAVMILMALDHTRDFFNSSAMSFSPTDLEKTTPILFFTRWITHFCLPVFMFTAGAGAFLWWRMGERTTGELSRFLWTRGLWFVVLELTVMRLAYNFQYPGRFPVFLLILWIFGICMIVMAALVHLPTRWLVGFSMAGIALHDCLDRVRFANFGWGIIHRPGVYNLAGVPVLVVYTLLPWLAVMTGGFCFAHLLLEEPGIRRRRMRRIGLAMTFAFLTLRSIDRYGDPAPWSAQKSGVFTVLSFLNCTKYPGSLDFLLMTLGPALVVLAWLDGRTWARTNLLIVFGRVPLFYFVLHFYLIHALAALLALVRYGGRAWAFVFNPPPSMGGQGFPSGYGYSLGVTYLLWIVVIASLYPVCRCYAGYKSTHRSRRLSYL